MSSRSSRKQLHFKALPSPFQSLVRIMSTFTILTFITQKLNSQVENGHIIYLDLTTFHLFRRQETTGKNIFQTFPTPANTVSNNSLIQMWWAINLRKGETFTRILQEYQPRSLNVQVSIQTDTKR